MAESFGWEIHQPDTKRARAYGVAYPKASVRISSGEDQPEYIQIPSALGRELARLKKQGEVNPCTRQEVMELIESNEKKVAWQQLVRMLEKRDRTAQDILNKLKQQGFGQCAVNEVVQTAKRSGLISNKRFASTFVRSKLSAGWGLLRIEQELKRRGIDVTTLEGWPHEYADPENERQRATEIASKKTVRDPNRYAKMVRFLQSRGFSYNISKSVATEVLAQ